MRWNVKQFYLALVKSSIQSISSRIWSNSARISWTISKADFLASSWKCFLTYNAPTALAKLPLAASTHVRHLEINTIAFKLKHHLYKIRTYAMYEFLTAGSCCTTKSLKKYVANIFRFLLVPFAFKVVNYLRRNESLMNTCKSTKFF